MIARYNLHLTALVVNGELIDSLTIEWEDPQATDESVNASVKRWVRQGQNPDESTKFMSGLESLGHAFFHVDVLPDHVLAGGASQSRIRGLIQ